MRLNFRKFKLTLNKLLVNVLDNHPTLSKFLPKIIRSFPFNKKYELYKIDYLKNLPEYKSLNLNTSSQNLDFVNIENDSQKVLMKILNGIGYLHINSAKLMAGSEFIFKKDKAYKQSYTFGTDLSNFNFANFKGSLANNLDFLLCFKNKQAKQKLNKIIYLSSTYDVNWHHWLLEVLPKLHILKTHIKDYNDYDIVVSQSVYKSKNHRDSLSLFRGVANVITINPLTQYKATNILYIESPSISNIEKKKDYKMRMQDGNFYREIFKTYKKEIENKLDTSEPKFGKRIYLSRDTSKRNFNQKEIVEVLSEFNFLSIDPGKLSFSEQVNMFNNAEIIVGTTGSAWANILFCNPSAKGLYLCPDKIGKFSAYPNLASVSGMRLYYQDLKIKEKDFQAYRRSSSEAIVDTKLLRANILKMIK